MVRLEALRCGATDYVLTQARVDEVVQAVRNVAAGWHYLSAALAERIRAIWAQRAPTGVWDRYETLTRRERGVLILAVKGYTNAESAVILGSSPRTVETHRAHPMLKLGLHPGCPNPL